MPVAVVNGEEQLLPEGATVAEVVRATGAPEGGRGVAVALDGQVVPRGQWDSTAVPEGARVEVLQAVQGG